MKSTVPIIILNWNGFDDTCACVASLLDSVTSMPLNILLIDNGSANDLVRLEEIYGNQDPVTVIGFEQNLGFASGINRVVNEYLDLLNVEHFVLLNNDTVVEPDWFENLLAYRDRADLVSSCMINYYDRDRMDNSGHLFLNTGEILPRGSAEPVEKHLTSMSTEGVCGGACLISTQVVKSLGLFDDYFDTGYEDAEFGLRAILAGFTAVYAPEAKVYHKIGQSINKIRDRRYAIRLQSNINFTYLKLMPTWVILANLPFIGVKFLGICFVALLTLRWRLLDVQANGVLTTLLELPLILRKRREASRYRRISSWEILRRQTFFLRHYVQYFRRFILRNEKTIFEK